MRKILVLSLIAVLVFTSFVAAVTWPFSKNATCGFMNQTGSACDLSWCQIQEGDWNTTMELCIFYINQTVISNATNQTVVVNSTDFYNKTESYNRTEIDNQFRTFSNSTDQNFARKSDVELLKSTQQTTKDDSSGFLGLGDSAGTIILIIVVLLGGFLIFKGKSGQQITPVQRGNAPQEQSLIQPKRDIERQARMDRMLDEMEEMKREKSRLERELDSKDKQKKASKKPSQKVEEDEETDESFEDDGED